VIINAMTVSRLATTGCLPGHPPLNNVCKPFA